MQCEKGGHWPPFFVDARGFTLVELVFVLVLLGILSAVAVPRFVTRSEVDARAHAEDIAWALRVARTRAIASGCPTRVVITAAGFDAFGAAAFCTSATLTTPLIGPDDTVVAGTAPAGVGVAGVPVDVVFASDGSTSLAADTALTVGAHAMTLYATTGFVEGP